MTGLSATGWKLSLRSVGNRSNCRVSWWNSVLAMVVQDAECVAEAGGQAEQVNASTGESSRQERELSGGLQREGKG